MTSNWKWEPEGDEETSGAPTPEQAIGPAYTAFVKDVSFLLAKWDTFEELFGSERGLAPMRKAARFASLVIQSVLMDEIMLHVCRLTDPPPGGTEQNLTLHTIMDSIRGKFEHSEMKPLSRIKKEIEKLAEPLRDHRNDRISHTALERALSPKPDWPHVSYDHVRTILGKFREFVLTMSGNYDAAQDVKPVIAEGAAGIVAYLRLGLEAEQICKKLGTGEIKTRDEAIERLRRADLDLPTPTERKEP
jgi:hypothetical protein